MKILINILAIIFLLWLTAISIGWLVLSGLGSGGVGLFGDRLGSGDYTLLILAIAGWILLIKYNSN